MSLRPIAPLGDCAPALAAVCPEGPISRAAALKLIRCPDDDLPELLAAARAAKERFKPGVITYSRKVFIPLTNLCRDYCGYCTFRRDPGDPGAHTMTPEEVLAVARAGEKLGCTEALFSLGDKPELLFPEMRETLRHLGYKSTLHYLEAMCELVLRETTLLPHPNPGLAERRVDRSSGGRFPQHGPDARNHERRPARARARPTTTLPTSFPRSACAPSKKPASRVFPSPPAC